MEPVEIARLEERRQALSLVALADEHELVAGGVVGFGGEGSWTNFASGLGLEGPVDDADIDRVVKFHLTRGVVPRVEVCPFADPTLMNGLVERGFVAQDYEKVLVRAPGPEEDPPADLEHSRWPGLELLPVDRANPGHVETFVRISAAGPRPADEPVPEGPARVARRSLADPDTDSLLVLLDGSVVGAAAVGYREGLAHLPGAALLPAAPRLGLQRALIVGRLDLARQRTCALAVVHAKPNSPEERDALLLDFSAAYTKVLLELRS